MESASCPNPRRNQLDECFNAPWLQLTIRCGSSTAQQRIRTQKQLFPHLMMALIFQPSPIFGPNEPIMRNLDRHQRAALVHSAPFRARDRASTDHLGSSGYAHLPREKQGQFDTRAWLGPILTAE
jgi:hypothetical protein